MSNHLLPIKDFLAFRAYVVNDESWRMPKRIFKNDECKTFPFKINELVKPCKYIESVLITPIKEYNFDLGEKHITLNIDFWNMVVSERLGKED